LVSKLEIFATQDTSFAGDDSFPLDEATFFDEPAFLEGLAVGNFTLGMVTRRSRQSKNSRLALLTSKLR